MEERRQHVQTRTYIDGNTVRRLEAAPDYRREQEKRREQEERRQKEIKRHNKHVARRNQEHALRMNLGYVFFLTLAAAVTALVSAAYIQLQSDVTGRMRRIAALESQVADLKADNDAALKRISTSIDLDYVKGVAINQLGMVYPEADQIVYYTIEDDDYMNQYSEIPER